MPVEPAKLRIIHYPDPALREPTEAVRNVDDHVRAVAERMIQLMHEARGVGLAAPQVGLPWRMFVANPTGEPDDNHVYINPELIDPTPQTEAHEEGCLSLPHIHADITRPLGVTLHATDEQGEAIQQTVEGFPARVWQHEFDHLQGVLILDRMSPIDKRVNRRAIRELEG